MTSKKRDWESCRKILRFTEEIPVDEAYLPILNASEFEGYSENQIGYHVYLLHDAGLLEVVRYKDNSHDWRCPRHLTMAGHDFLEATRNDRVWNKTLSFIKSGGGSVTLAIFKEIASGFLRAELGLGG